MNQTMHERRGMLLLLVLSMLTLFLMMGATLLVVATRARTAARAFMNATSGADASPVMPRAFLDEALMLLIRGSKDSGVTAVLNDSLLRDMYESDNNKVPFRGEPHDAFDAVNPFLTKFASDGSVSRAAFQGNLTATDIKVDNDGDGNPDGVWLPAGNSSVKLLPDVTSGNGGTLSFRLSYLVRDLDSRINVNAHGGAAGGAPVGPASIDASSLEAFDGGAWAILQNGGTPSGRTPHAGDLRQPPVLGRAIPGRGGDAYALRLDRKASPPSGSPLTTAQPFVLGELERVLRPFDGDWTTLPPRLSAILADPDHAARETVTTDSWDVPYTTGEAAPTAANANPELKFDLTSNPGNNASAKQAFAVALFEFIAPQGAPPPRPMIALRDAVTAQWCANVAEFREGMPGTAPQTMSIGGFNVTGVKPDVLRADAGVWTGAFASSADLAAIPTGSKSEIDAILDESPQITPLHSLVVSKPAILDAVQVPTRFTASFNQDPVREPGRVNVNTCTSDVWDAVSGPGGPPQPTDASKTLWDLLGGTSFTGAGGVGPKDVRKFDRQMGNRLASIATFRSNVFAVWITIEVKNSAVTAGDLACYRLFAIVDRSIPVTYVAGENKNASETIRLKRFLN